MKAEETKYLMIQKAISIEAVLERVKSVANNGYPSVFISEYLTDDVIKGLIDLGYYVRRVDGLGREKLIEVSWI